MFKQPNSIYVASFCSLFTLYFSSLRIYELWQIPEDVEIAPGYPIWLLKYLWGISLGLAISSLVGLYYLLLASSGLLRRRWLVVPGICFALWILARACYLLQDPDVGTGGIIWGVYDVITVTRNVATATEAGTKGYRTGQILGLLVFATIPFLFIYSGLSEPHVNSERDDEQTNAPNNNLH